MIEHRLWVFHTLYQFTEKRLLACIFMVTKLSLFAGSLTLYLYKSLQINGYRDGEILRIKDMHSIMLSGGS
jgi:hypothetical protein